LLVYKLKALVIRAEGFFFNAGFWGNKIVVKGIALSCKLKEEE